MESKLQKYFLFLIAVFVFLSVPLLRLFSGLNIADSEPYYHLRISSLLHNKITNYDELSFSGRAYYLNLNHLILSRFNNITFFVMFLPLVFGILSVFLFYRILEKFNISQEQNLIICLLLVSSPAFIYTFTIYNLYFIPIFLILFGLYFFMQNNIVVSTLCFSLVPLFNLALFPLVIFFIFIYYLNNNKKGFVVLSSIVSFISIVYYFAVYYPLSFPQLLNLPKQGVLMSLVSDFGSQYGFSFFLLILALIGFYISWRNKRKYLQLYIILLVLFLISYFFPRVNLILNFFIVYLAGLTIFSLINLKWKLDLVKKATILLIICGLLFSTISYFNRLLKMEPTNYQIKSLTLIKEDSKQGAVLSHYSNGFWIEYFTDRPVLMDGLLYHAPNINERYNDSQTIFYSRNLDPTKKLLDKYNIKYIWIDNKMKSGLVWEKEEQGLLFLLQNRETFKNIYNSPEVEIWEYLG